LGPHLTLPVGCGRKPGALTYGRNSWYWTSLKLKLISGSVKNLNPLLNVAMENHHVYHPQMVVFSKFYVQYPEGKRQSPGGSLNRWPR
jgi:hypothetical protein